MSDGERTAPYPVFTDEPGVLLHQPRRQLAKVLILYALLPLVCAGASSYITYTLANSRTDHRIAALETDLADRRAARARLDAEQQRRDAERAAADAQLRRDACVAFDRLPRDAEVLSLRRRYGCTGNPGSAVAPSPGASPPSSRSPARQGGGGSGRGGVPAPVPTPAPRPGPQGPPGKPGPSGPPGPAPPEDGLICLPIVGCLL